MNTFAKTITTWFGCGYSPIAPGTVGSLGACGCVIILHSIFGYKWMMMLLIFGIIIFTILGIKLTNVLENLWGKDPSKIVVDEVVGLWIAFLFVPFSYINLLIAFVLFRFFDILKPLGIRKLESLDGGLGVMADDILAGIYANLILQAFLYGKQFI